MRARVGRGFDRLAAVDGRYPAMLFFGVLLAYTLALLVQAVGYSAAARLFPLTVGVPLVVMLVANILLLALGDRFDLRLVGFFDAVGEIDRIAAEAEVDAADRYARELAMILWVGALVALTWLVGTLVGVVVFVFAFVYAHERASLRAVLVAGLTFGFIYLLFVVVLGARLWRGVIPLGGVLP